MKIPWWFTEVDREEQKMVLAAFKDKCFSMGKYTSMLEEKLSSMLNVPYVVVTNSGTSALTMALLCSGIKEGDEVIVPALTWIATAQAASILGAKVVLADCLSDEPIIDSEKVREKVSGRTRAILPVHLNGRACDLENINQICEEGKICLIEDACKAMGSKYNEDSFMGTIGEMGCFSMGMISLVSCGYGGFVVTRNKETYEKLKSIRNHGILSSPERYVYQGFNFKISDVLCSIGVAQVERIEEKTRHVIEIHRRYSEGLSSNEGVSVLKVDVSSGKVPLYTEASSERRTDIEKYLLDNEVEISKFHLPLAAAGYLNAEGECPNAEKFSRECFILPSGPSQPLENIDRCIEILSRFK